MSLALLFPLGLAALSAWLLPLLLHLARREQRTPTEFAALRWLSIRQKPRQRLRFEELPLLVLRLLLIAAIVGLLARMVLVGGAGDAPWLVVHPALPAPAPVDGDTRERRWLAPGFPTLDSPRPATPVATSSLLRQLDAELPATTAISVQVPEILDGVDGERPRLSRAIDLQVRAAPAAATAETVAEERPAPALAIRHDEAHSTQLRWLRAVAIAWATPATAGGEVTDASIDIGAPSAPLPAPSGTALAWFAEGPLPAAVREWVERGGTALLAKSATWPAPAAGAVAWSDENGDALAVAASFGRGRVVQLRVEMQPVTLPALLEPTFPRQLQALVQPAPPAPTRVDAAAHAPLAGGAGFPPTPRALDDLVAWLVLALFALERLLATGRRAEAPP